MMLCILGTVQIVTILQARKKKHLTVALTVLPVFTRRRIVSSVQFRLQNHYILARKRIPDDTFWPQHRSKTQDEIYDKKANTTLQMHPWSYSTLKHWNIYYKSLQSGVLIFLWSWSISIIYLTIASDSCFFASSIECLTKWTQFQHFSTHIWMFL